jgi:hypothetical protein
MNSLVIEHKGYYPIAAGTHMIGKEVKQRIYIMLPKKLALPFTLVVSKTESSAVIAEKNYLILIIMLFVYTFGLRLFYQYFSTVFSNFKGSKA